MANTGPNRGSVEVYVCECGNAVTAATVQWAEEARALNYATDVVICNNVDAHGRGPAGWPEMRREVFDFADSKTRSMPIDEVKRPPPLSREAELPRRDGPDAMRP